MGARLIVRSHADGYRRAGRAWSAAGVEIDEDEIGEAGLAALLADPRIQVTPAPADPAPADPAPADPEPADPAPAPKGRRSKETA